MPARAFALEEDVREKHGTNIGMLRDGLRDSAFSGTRNTVDPEDNLSGVGLHPGNDLGYPFLPGRLHAQLVARALHVMQHHRRQIERLPYLCMLISFDWVCCNISTNL